MTKTVNFFTSDLVAWLMRLANGPSTRGLLTRDPVVFASWYTLAGPLLAWPAEVTQIQETHRNRKLRLEQLTRLTSELRLSMPGQPSARRAKELLEGYAVGEWVAEHSAAFTALLQPAMERYDSIDEIDVPSANPDMASLNQLENALQLPRLQKSLLRFAVSCSVSSEIASLVAQFSENRWAADALWTTLFKASRQDLEAALRPDSALRMSGLLRRSFEFEAPAVLSHFWVGMLAASDNLFNTVLEPVTDKRGSGTPARLLEEDLELAGGIVRNAERQPGINLLLYGSSRLDKRQLLKSVVEKAGRTAWRVRAFDDAGPDDRASLVYVAQRLLAKHQPDSVLVVERPGDALSSTRGQLLRVLFGIEVDPSEVKPFEEHLLDSNPVPTVWLASTVNNLPDDLVARFVFHAPLKKADRKDRIAQLEELLADYKLTRKAKEDILKLDGVSAAQLEAAMKAAQLMKPANRRERDAIVVQAVRRSQRALSRDVTAKHKRSVTQYSLKYLNVSGRFRPEDILRCLKERPRGSLLFYGLSGSGKTQLAEYLAAELGLPLVAKRASDLLSKWVGESEKNIAAAFEEATADDAVLLLDEGDSFLQDRSRARENWQVTQVNELLQHIERFEGIVIMCTNLFEGLDTAALRRFTFKLEFCELAASQRWEMFQEEAGLKGKLNTIEPKTREDWQERLWLMYKLTPGDFATVKRQSEALGVALTPDAWVEQLEIECKAKQRA